MAEELVQRIVVQVQGAGNLPQHLADARAQADALTRSIGTVNGAASAVDRTNPDLDSVFDGTQGQRTAGSPGPTVSSSGGTWGQHGAAVAAANAALANNMTLAERMSAAWELASKQAKVAAEAAERTAVVERKRIEHYQRQDDAFEATKRKSQTESERQPRNPHYGGVAGSAYSSTANALASMRDAAILDQMRKDGEAKRKEAMNWNITRGGAAFAGGLGAATSFGSLANPWEMERFTKASRDLGAVLGRDLVPYLQIATRVVRGAADAWISLPGPLRSTVAGVIALGTVVGGGVLAFGLLQRGLATVAASATATAAALGLQSRANVAVAGTSAGMLAIAARVLPFIAVAGLAAYAFGNRKDNSSYGMAVGNASITSAEGYLSELQVDALKASVDAQRESNLWLEKIFNKIIASNSIPEVADSIVSDRRASAIAGALIGAKLGGPYGAGAGALIGASVSWFRDQL